MDSGVVRMNDVSAFALGQAHFRECQLNHEFLNAQIRPRLLQAFQAAPNAVTGTHYGYWPAARPQRWTGRDLARDAEAATSLFPEGGFQDFYETRYQQVCWDTHGTGIAS